MKRVTRSFAAVRMGGLLMCAALPLPAWACAGVSARDERVRVVDESAVIVWDAAIHQERFIRRATFHTSAENFGFLVPTPSLPKLTEVNDGLFRSLERMIEPRVIEQKSIAFRLSAFSVLPVSDTAITHGTGGSDVQVLDTQHVAGYDAVVLSAGNSAALQTWLQSHGYVAQPELLAWLRPYIQAHWKIAAFKIAKAAPYSGETASSAVEMAFTTSRPFFPYREPANQRAPGNYSARSLRVFLLSSARMEGRLGKSASPGSWPGKVVSASPITEAQRKILDTTPALAAPQLPTQVWLTAFEDDSTPRPGTDDVYFSPSAQQTPVVPPPITVVRVKHISIPLELFAGIAGTLIFLRRDWRRKRLPTLPRRQ